MAATGEFQEPDWHGPLDLQERLDAMPSGVAVKGMFFEQVRDTLGEQAEDVDPGGR